ncbi:hypothetical protein J6590_024994 [Homalodisca vitripennis]|nr:hypothetical protein J6590_024994 [Homalodisca vitripennis]
MERHTIIALGDGCIEMKNVQNFNSIGQWKELVEGRDIVRDFSSPSSDRLRYRSANKLLRKTMLQMADLIDHFCRSNNRLNKPSLTGINNNDRYA